MDISVIEYRGYKIWQNTRSIPRHNPISGHHWNDQEIVKNSFYISGKGARVTDNYRSIQKAKDHVDFLIRAEEIIASA